MPPPETLAGSRALQLGTAALRLREAYTNGSVGPLRDFLSPRDIDGAYAVQDINTAYWRGGGRRHAGTRSV